MLLTDKTALVTGTGIGKAIALRYAREGAHVVGAEIDEASGQQTAAEVSAHGRRGLFVKTDMSRPADISEAEALAQMDAIIPLRRSNTPDDIADMAAFLASAEARNITGQSLNVDGGLMWD